VRGYEAMVIIAPTLDATAVQAAMDRIVKLIADQGGVVERIDPWGRRRLAYELGQHREGFYVVINFRAEPPAVAELERVLRLSEEILRHIVVRQEEVPAPAAPEGAEGPEGQAAPEPQPAPAAGPAEG
jgi:small subunit ribosomal protein S6